MTGIGHLWAVGYDDIERAAQVRDEVARLGETRCLILLEAAVVVRYPDESVTLDGEPFVAVPRVHCGTVAGFQASLALAALPPSAPC
jgi:hypothetical protein